MGVRLCLTALCFAICWVGQAKAEMTIAVVGKTKNDSFYEQAFAGCSKFAAGVESMKCIYDGPADYQDPRSQAKVVETILNKNVDGILLSTTDSNFLVERVLKRAKESGIPVITFDSDLLPQHRNYRLAYVGTNNFDFGIALGNYAKKFKKARGITELCIQSGSDKTPNLNERIRGVRYALSGSKINSRLVGENGWVEHKRCPFYNMGKRDRALTQLKFVLAQEEPPVFLAVAGFAQFSPDYIREVLPFREQIAKRESVIISADAETVQLEALRKNLSTVNIGQRPFEMGRFSAQLIHDYIRLGKKPDKEINYLGFYFCKTDQEELCALDNREGS